MADKGQVCENEENIVHNFSSYTNTRNGDHYNALKPTTHASLYEKEETWLKQKGLQIKVMPKNQESLFRAVAETIFLTQANWEKLKNQLLKYLADRRLIFEKRVRLAYAKEMNTKPFGDLERDVHDFGSVCGKEPVTPWHAYMYRLANGSNVASVIEISAMCSLYKCTISLYRAIPSVPLVFGTKCETDETRNIKLLNFYGSNHYDLLIPINSSSAVCQSVVYEMLYEKVFGLRNSLAASALALGNSKPSSKCEEREDSRRKRLLNKIDEDEPDALKHLKNEHLPFPLKVAKSIDPSTFRESNLDSPPKKSV